MGDQNQMELQIIKKMGNQNKMELERIQKHKSFFLLTMIFPDIAE